MKLTLRKANTIRTEIEDKIKSLDMKTDVNLNEFQPVASQIHTAREVFWKNLEQRNGLVDALYEIRQKVSRANAESGINDKLAQAAHLEKQTSYLTNLGNRKPQTDIAVLDGMLERLREEKGDRYAYSRMDSTSTSIFTAEELEDFRKTAANTKREKQRLQDQLLELNVQTQIKLDGNTVDFLKSVDIL